MTAGGGCSDVVNAWPDPAAARLMTSPGKKEVNLQKQETDNFLCLLTQCTVALRKPCPPRRRSLCPSGSDPPLSRQAGGRGHAWGLWPGFFLQDTGQKTSYLSSTFITSYDPHPPKEMAGAPDHMTFIWQILLSKATSSKCIQFPKEEERDVIKSARYKKLKANSESDSSSIFLLVISAHFLI